MYGYTLYQAMCAQCGIPPTKFCLCYDQPVLLCDNCTAIHEYQARNQIHDSNPISYYPILCHLGADAFRMQKRQLSMGQTLVSRIQDFEQRQYLEAKQRLDKVMRQYNQWLDYLHEKFLQRVTVFEQEKILPMTSTSFNLSEFSFFIYGLGEVQWPQDALLVEMEALNRFEADVSALDSRLRQSSGPSEDFQSFYISKLKSILSPPQVPIVPSAIPISPSVPNTPPPQPIPIRSSPISVHPKPFTLYVPFSRGQLLAKWNSSTTDLDKVVLSRALNLSNLTVSVILPDGNLIYCGGKGRDTKMCVLVDTESGRITDLPHLSSPRGNAGIVYCSEFVYLFGGFQPGSGEDLSTAEKFSLHIQSWTPFREKMKSPRFQFSPCEYQRKVYLAGGWKAQGVEIFDIPTEKFSQLPLTLPKEFGTTAFVCNNELIILQDTKCIRWKIGSSASATSSNLSLSVKDSNVCPIVQGGKAYYTRETDVVCEVHMFDCASGNVEKVANLSSGGNLPCPVS